MIAPVAHQSSVFYAAFGREAELIKDDLLEEVDALLDDPVIVSIARDALAERCRHSKTTGRRGKISPDQLARSCALKHLKGWSFRELEREIRGSLVYRRFTHYHGGSIPKYKNFSCAVALLGEEGTRRIHERVVRQAIERRVARGNKLRTDTTVVESNVHYPTDSTLLGDGLRVLTRTLKGIAQECESGAIEVIDHALAAKRRIIEIHRAAKSKAEDGKERLVQGYRRLVGLASGVVRQAEDVAGGLKSGAIKVGGESTLRVVALTAQIEHFTPLVKRVIAQTKARVFEGDHHHRDKLLSIFEEHTAAICKGKAHKPTEFGHLVRIDEVENGIVSSYEIEKGNPADQEAWEPALTAHEKTFEHPPRMATADRGYQSAANERLAEEKGVKQVALPARGRLSQKQAEKQSERWFKRARRWRAGIEARIATLKNVFGMDRAQYKGHKGFKRYVGWSVIAQNLVTIARAVAKRKVKDAEKIKRAA